uniref:Uncharacterized protein isoform X1 n=1 Tax=Nicotiana tabacum TaxID=4097 RepID=A0A1S4CH95_TOBAC|nr:PREDICTED: uncharacterized protein LOC107818992 isoform X1 [Nicotiana tabacum]
MRKSSFRQLQVMQIQAAQPTTMIKITIKTNLLPAIFQKRWSVDQPCDHVASLRRWMLMECGDWISTISHEICIYKLQESDVSLLDKEKHFQLLQLLCESLRIHGTYFCVLCNDNVPR